MDDQSRAVLVSVFPFQAPPVEADVGDPIQSRLEDGDAAEPPEVFETSPVPVFKFGHML